jgi:hypothetical protein
MSEPAKTKEQTPDPEAERDATPRAAQAGRSDDDGPLAGPSLDLPMSSPD